MQLHGGAAIALVDGRQQSLATFRGQRVHGVAAIGNPQRFFDSLRETGIEVLAHAFADHHTFVAAELDFADGLPVLMTDKDAVKCASFAQPDWFRVPVQAQLPAAFFDTLTTRVEALLRRH
jgi:tetraacyldisaccharide 4'-kinase